MVGLFLALLFLTGAAVGSFINVLADRLPLGQSIVFPPSHCPACQHRLGAGDMVPVFSYLWLKGRCHYCGTAIPRRILWVELGMGALFMFLYWHYGLVWELAIVAFYCCLFVAVLLTDLEHRIIPNIIVYPGMVIALAVAVFASPGLKSAAIGGAVGLGLLLIPALISRGGMGWGDVKLAGMIGLVTGFPLAFVAIFLAIFAGAVVGVALLLLKVKSRKEAIPFGPFLSLAAMATLFWGNDIVVWYLGLA